MKGKVYLVGAGPGDYGLLTLKGLACIQEADVIVYDRLANKDYLKEAKSGCEMIYVGKASSNHTLTQDEINEVITKEALKGKIVTRLKGGDPYVFGRGGEEGEYLLQFNVPFEVVPGITSAIGGLCYAGIPITHRDYTSSFHVVTGHLKDDEHTSINWQALARMGGTLVFLMGVSNLEKICHNLITEGMSEEIPVAVINWATRANQKVVTGNLRTIGEVVKREKVTSPSLIVVGKVVELRDKLNFFEQNPLFGQTIVTTRARVQSSDLVSKLKALGAKVIEAPTIKIQPLQDQSRLEEAIKAIKSYSYLLFTSQNAVTLFFEQLYNQNLDTRALAHLQIGVIGKATKDKLKDYGICADILPERYVAEALCEKLIPRLTSDDRILLPTAKVRREVLQTELEKVCSVDVIPVYETVMDTTYREEVIQAIETGTIDYITFTSSSTVTYFKELVGEEAIRQLGDTQLISIGEVTSQTLQAYGLTHYKEAEKPSIEAIIETILNNQMKKERVE